MGAKMSRVKFASVPPMCSVVFRAETAEAENSTVQNKAANMGRMGTWLGAVCHGINKDV